MTFWINGIFEKNTQAIDITDRGFLLGDGLFETFSVQNGCIQDFEPHFSRLKSALNIFDFSIAFSQQELHVAANKLIIKDKIQNGSLRLTVTRGIGPRGLLPPIECQPTILMTCAASNILPNNFPEAKLVFSEILRNDTSPASNLKTIGGYLDNILSLQNAKSRGADDAILLNTKGKIACTTIANIFIKINQDLFTPPVSDGILNGITRQKWINDCITQETPVYIESLSKEDIENADEIWVTNSLIGRRKAIIL